MGHGDEQSGPLFAPLTRGQWAVKVATVTHTGCLQSASREAVNTALHGQLHREGRGWGWWVEGGGVCGGGEGQETGSKHGTAVRIKVQDSVVTGGGGGL